MKRTMAMIICLLLAVLFAGCSQIAGTNPQINEKPRLRQARIRIQI